MKVKDLPDPMPDHIYLYCTKCQSEYSANPRDYWYAVNGNESMKCCRKNLILVEKQGLSHQAST